MLLDGFLVALVIDSEVLVPLPAEGWLCFAVLLCFNASTWFYIEASYVANHVPLQFSDVMMQGGWEK